MSDSLWPHGLQHARLLYHQLPEPAQIHVPWISDAIQPPHPLSSPSLSAFDLSQHQGLFPMSQFFASDGQSIEASASALVLPMNIQGWFPIGLTGLISLLSKEHSRIFSSTTIRKYQFSDTQPSLWCNSRAVECFLFLNFSPQFYRAESDFPLWSIITGVNIRRLPTPFLDFHYHLFSIFT